MHHILWCSLIAQGILPCVNLILEEANLLLTERRQSNPPGEYKKYKAFIKIIYRGLLT